MALREETRLFIGIHDDGQMEIRRTRRIFDDSELIGEKHHRTTLEPGQDVSTLGARIRRVCEAVWTPQVVTDFQTAKAIAVDNALKTRVSPPIGV